MKLIALDLSTSCTGFAIFDVETKALLEYGTMKPKVKGVAKYTYPKGQLLKMQNLANQIKELIDSKGDVSAISIEEINSGVSRIGQKVLDGFHFILLDRIQDRMDMISFRDSDGDSGWRRALNLVLGENDKRLNAERRRRNEAIPEGEKELPLITKKHLACRFVNKTYGLQLDPDENKTDSDVGDAIGLGHVAVNGL